MPDNTELDDFEDFAEEERPRGILTKEDRRFLTGKKEVSEQTARDTRYRIRERVKNSLADFGLLHDLPDDDRKTIFESLDHQGLPAVGDALSFLYLGVKDIEEDFETLLARAIKEAMFRKDPERIISVSVDIEIEEEEPSVEDVIDRLIAGEGTLNDFNYLAVKGEIIPVLEHYLEQEEDLHLTAPSNSDTETMVFPTDELDQLRGLYKRHDDGGNS